MQQSGKLCRFMQQPVLNVVGTLAAAGATKIGYAGLAAETIGTVITIYLSAIIVSVMVRKLVFWVGDARDGRRSVVLLTPSRLRRGGVAHMSGEKSS